MVAGRKAERPRRTGAGRRCLTAARPERSGALVLFGATGDLAKKKIFPALYRLALASRADLPIIGVATREWDDDQLRATPGRRSRPRTTRSTSRCGRRSPPA